MSTGKDGESTSHEAAYEHSDQIQRQATSSTAEFSSPQRLEDDQASTPASASPADERGSIPQRDQPSEESTYPSTEETTQPPRQVIAVSASKGPAAFFNLARKFLVTDEVCDLSALEGAIVSAVDAAHLLERSKLATIVRYVLIILTITGFTANAKNSRIFARSFLFRNFCYLSRFSFVLSLRQSPNIICDSRAETKKTCSIYCTVSSRHICQPWNPTNLCIIHFPPITSPQHTTKKRLKWQRTP